jgi:hypothetical protein
MDKLFRIGLLVGVFAIALGFFQNSQNGRYQYSSNGNVGIIVDTRTGEFWTEQGITSNLGQLISLPIILRLMMKLRATTARTNFGTASRML